MYTKQRYVGIDLVLSLTTTKAPREGLLYFRVIQYYSKIQKPTLSDVFGEARKDQQG